MIQAYFEGLLTQVRIENNVELMRDAIDSIYAMLGVKEAEAATV
jgi:hypothetical protein